MKVKILVPFRLEIDRKAVEFEPGIAEMPDSAVEAFINAGYAALIEDEPAIKIVAKNEGKRKAQVK